MVSCVCVRTCTEDDDRFEKIFKRARVGVTELHSYQQTEVHAPRKPQRRHGQNVQVQLQGLPGVEKYTPPAYELTTAAARRIIFRGGKMIVSYT